MKKIISVILLGMLISLASCDETASKTSVESDTTVEVVSTDVTENSSSLNTEASTKSAFEAALPSTSLPLTTQAPQTTTTKTAQTTTTQSVGTTSKESIFERDKYFFMNAQSDNLRSQYPIASNVRFYTDESHNDYYFKDVDGTNDKLIAFTSQLAHIVSNAYVKSPSALERKGISAGSYKDLTRVAYLNENMWTELFLENKENLDNLCFILNGKDANDKEINILVKLEVNKM